MKSPDKTKSGHEAGARVLKEVSKGRIAFSTYELYEYVYEMREKQPDSPRITRNNCQNALSTILATAGLSLKKKGTTTVDQPGRDTQPDHSGPEARSRPLPGAPSPASEEGPPPPRDGKRARPRRPVGRGRRPGQLSGWHQSFFFLDRERGRPVFMRLPAFSLIVRTDDSPDSKCKTARSSYRAVWTSASASSRRCTQMTTGCGN